MPFKKYNGDSCLQGGRAKAVLVVAAAMAWAGCAPTVYHTPGGAKISSVNNTFVVPRDYDYRRDYRVPADRLTGIIDAYLGVRYKYGGTTRKGMDCSGFVVVVFRELNRAKMPRSSRKQWRLGYLIPVQKARAGDLVFFKGGAFNRINHVGIITGDGGFAHASTSSGVRYSRLDEEYYRKHLAGVRRIF